MAAGICDEKRTLLLGLMERIGGPVIKMAPESILLIARAGSYLYHLDTATSDIDYIVIYAEPTEVCGKITEFQLLTLMLLVANFTNTK